MESVQQRNTLWHEQRRGKFTASEIIKLLGVKGLGETGKSYAIEKAIEELYGIEENSFISFDMARGIETEPLAFAKFAELKESEFLEVTECGFFSVGNYGASPDGLVGSDAILEIKCPTKSTFFKLVASNEVDPKYYAQMQLQMLVTKRNKAYFFNYLIIDGKEYHHEIILDKNDVFCENMLKRIEEATEIKNEFINKINTNKQW